MKHSISVKRFCLFVLAGVLLTATLLTIILYLCTKTMAVVLSGILVTSVFLIWGGVFLHFFQNRLIHFTSTLCQTLDGMINGNESPMVNYEEETQFSRISHRLEQLYNIMQKTRCKVAEEKSELQSLISDISHQTKTPIANLKMINETLLTRCMTEEKQKEFLQATGNQLNKLDFLVQAMVKTSRLETGVITLEKKDCPISDTLAAAINGVLAQIEVKQIFFSVNCPDDLNVAHDSRWTTEALFNLLDNAVKYTPVNGCIRVDVQQWEMYLKIDVADTGRGIPESEYAKIFKRFYREDVVHNIDGIGIGLYLAREIITMQGGYIKLTSQVGVGSTFSVFLPRR